MRYIKDNRYCIDFNNTLNLTAQLVKSQVFQRGVSNYKYEYLIQCCALSQRGLAKYKLSEAIH